MLRKRPKERLPRLRNPGDPEPERGTPGSIEQQLDMCEEGSLRGDEILHHQGRTEEDHRLPDVPPVDRLLERYQLDLSEENREGDEWSGDDHSGGLQGGASELSGQLHIPTGMPGDLRAHGELHERSDWTLTEEFPEGIQKHETSPRKAGVSRNKKLKKSA